tara:strand:+ start:737 stop:1711 length:975 start_codon:yes stop_codon:yes gene_type:complete
MKKLFFLILLLGVFFGAQIVYFQSVVKSDRNLDFDEISNSIVSIESQPSNPNQRFGSGVIISSDGYIITAFHLLSGSQSSIKIDEKVYTANLIGFDEYADLAVLKVTIEDARPIVFSSSDDLQIGDTVYALGNPYNLGISVSKGIISATGRNLGNPYLDIIQTDAAINLGSSGGAILNENGELVGLSTLIASTSGGSDGVGFALPSSRVLSIANEIIKYGFVSRAWIGDFIFRRSFYDLENERVPAIYVFESNMPLTQNSIDGGLINGDIIIDIKGSQALWSTLRASVNSISPGETLELTVIRDGKRKKLEIITKKRPNTPQAL